MKKCATNNFYVKLDDFFKIRLKDSPRKGKKERRLKS